MRFYQAPDNDVRVGVVPVLGDDGLPELGGDGDATGVLYEPASGSWGVGRVGPAGAPGGGPGEVALAAAGEPPSWLN